MGRYLALAAASLIAVAASSARAELFPDNQARSAILELRAKVEQQGKRLAEMTAAQEEVQQLRRSLLELNNQLESLRADLARQRGDDEKLARDVAELQRRQQDIAQGVDARLSKFEPNKVSLDGKEFLADADEKRQYDGAFALIRAGDFAGAVRAFDAFAKRFPASGYLDSVRFWVGNAHYGQRDYKDAIASFRSFIAGAPTHTRVPEALLAVANCQAEMRDKTAARATLRDLLKKYPQSEAAQAGKERLAALK